MAGCPCLPRVVARTASDRMSSRWLWPRGGARRGHPGRSGTPRAPAALRGSCVALRGAGCAPGKLRCASDAWRSRMQRKSVSRDAGATQVWRDPQQRPRAGGLAWVGPPERRAAPAARRAGAARPSAGVGAHSKSAESGRSVGRRDTGAPQTGRKRSRTDLERAVSLASGQDGPTAPALSVHFQRGCPPRPAEAASRRATAPERSAGAVLMAGGGGPVTGARSAGPRGLPAGHQIGGSGLSRSGAGPGARPARPARS